MADHTDERIRALMARVVAEAPSAPAAEEVAPLITDRSSGSRPEHRLTELGVVQRRRRTAGRRGVLAAVASIVVVGLVAVGLLAVVEDPGDIGTSSGQGPMFQANPVRFVPEAMPAGMRLAGIEDSVAGGRSPVPPPRVAVYEGPGGLRVRIVVALRDVSGSSGPTTTVAEAPGDTTETTSPPATDSTAPSGTDATTTSLFNPSTGRAAREGPVPVPVRSAAGGIERQGATASTIWFQQDAVVTVEVFGADAATAERIAHGLTPRPDGGFDPAPAERLVNVIDLPPGSADAPQPATSTVAYAPDDAPAGVALAVTTTKLAPGRGDLLTATAGWFGELQQWGEREVLIQDRQAFGTGGIAASFVDASGVLVTVWTPTGDGLRSHVEGLEAVDAAAWRDLVARESARVAGLPSSSRVELDGTTIASRQGDGQTLADLGYCLEVEGARACRPAGVTEGVTPDGAVQGESIQVLLDGHWWAFGYVAREAELVAVTPDAGEAEVHITTTDEARWFAVRLPDQAGAATLRFRTADSADATASLARPAS